MTEILKVVESLLNVLKEFKAADIVKVLQEIPFDKVLEMLKTFIELITKIQ